MSENYQPLLQTECASCSWNLSGWCEEPRNARTYLINHPTLATCLDPARREAAFADTFKTLRSRTRLAQLATIPNFIATALKGVVKISGGFEQDLFGISLGKIIGRRGNFDIEDVSEIKSRFGLSQSSDVALIGTSPDLRLERLYRIHKTHRIYERIAALGFKWATSLTFSVWATDFPRPEQLRSQGRNYDSYDAFTSFGLPCIPFLFPVDESDFRYAAHWLEDRPEISSVAVYARYYGSENGYQELRRLLLKIQRMAPRPLTFLVCGIANPRNIERLRYEFDIRFENSKLFATVMRHRLIGPDLKPAPSEVNKEELLRIGLERYQTFCDPDKPLVYLPARQEEVAELHEIGLPK